MCIKDLSWGNHCLSFAFLKDTHSNTQATDKQVLIEGELRGGGVFGDFVDTPHVHQDDFMKF